ncbi:11581_t:CDS:2 [Gigaspora rosea]|nr:11581_t:CDS:2 [Gigaspora rosea]
MKLELQALEISTSSSVTFIPNMVTSRNDQLQARQMSRQY